jgi:FkbM family methyltransferase
MNPYIDPRFDSVYAAHPLVLVDVGARGGLRPNWRRAQTHLHHVAFEPEPDEHRRLTAAASSMPYRSTVLGVALHRDAGPIELKVARSGGLSSIFEPNHRFLGSFPDSQRFETTRVAAVQADSLDHQLAANGIDDVDFIKIDTQGSELFVLQGAKDALAQRVLGVEVEVSFTTLYTGQPLFADVDILMRGAGFSLFDLRPCYWKRRLGPHIGGPRGQIIWADALYLKTLPTLAPVIEALAGTQRSKALKAITIALLYGYGDFALELADGIPGLDRDDRRIVEQRIRTELASPSGPSIPGRASVAALFRRLWQICRPPSSGWSVSRSELGNFE